MEKKKILMLAASIAACLLAGLIGSFFTAPAIGGWYAGLEKPWFNPPSWVFAPVWTALYVLMGVALYLAWEKGLEGRQVNLAMVFFGAQLVLNALWSIIFFGLQEIFLAFIEIIFLWLAIAATTAFFWRVSRKAALLMVPYLLWVGFAAFLNYSLLALNA